MKEVGRRVGRGGGEGRRHYAHRKFTHSSQISLPYIISHVSVSRPTKADRDKMKTNIFTLTCLTLCSYARLVNIVSLPLIHIMIVLMIFFQKLKSNGKYITRLYVTKYVLNQKYT